MKAQVQGLNAGNLLAGLLVLALISPAAAVTLKPGDIVVGDDSPRVSVVDPQTRIKTVICNCTTLATLWDLAVKGTEKIYAVGTLPTAKQAVVEIDPASGQQRVVSSGGNFVRLEGIAVEADGNLVVSDNRWVAQGLPSRIIRVDPVTGQQTVLATGSSSTMPDAHGVAVGPDGSIFVATSMLAHSGIVRVDKTTGQQTVIAFQTQSGTAPADRTEMIGPSDLTVAADGTIYVLDKRYRGSNLEDEVRLFTVNPVTGAQKELTRTLKGVDRTKTGFDFRGIDVFNGVVFAIDYRLGTSGLPGITRFDPLVGFRVDVSSDNFYEPSGLAIVQSASGGAGANFQGLWWNAPAGSESGWGINFAHQGVVIFATWFTYDAARKPWWLIALLDKSAAGVYSGAVWTVTGPPFSSAPFPPEGSPGGAVEVQVGTMTATFTDAAHGTILYTVNGVTQTKTIQPQAFGTLPACVWGAQPNLALATNYTDLWWNISESGWGINFTHQGDVIFATWFTYDAARQPWWLIALLDRTAGSAYAGPVWTVSGPPFNSVPFPPEGSPGGAIETEVGTATATFAGGNSATFAYTVNGVAQTKTITRQVFVPPGTVCR